MIPVTVDKKKMNDKKDNSRNVRVILLADCGSNSGATEDAPRQA